MMTGRPGRALLTILSVVLLAQSSSSVPALAQPATRADPPDPFTARLELMLRTMRIARDWHVGRPAKAELVAGAIEGLLARVDPEAELYTRADLRRVSRYLPAGDGNVGLEIRREPPVRRQERPGYRVVSAHDGSPAALAGLKAGDLITHVDGRPAGEIPHLVMTDVELAGTVGTELSLTVDRAGTDETPVDVHLVRSAEPAMATAADEVAPGVSRVRLASIDTNAANSLAPVLEELAAMPTRSARGIVIDLRSVSGISLDAATAIGDAFLDSGSIVQVQDRSSGPMRTMDATAGDLVQGRPVIVLVDRGTAGAAEAVAAALRHHNRARLVGTSTAGRSALRTLVPLGNRREKGAIRMTTARMLTPLGATFEGKGLVPDVVLEQTPASPRCRSLDTEDKREPTRCVRRAVSEDAQLARAIELLNDAQIAAKGAAAPAKP